MPESNTATDQQDPIDDNNNQTQDSKKKRTGPKRRKVTHGKYIANLCMESKRRLIKFYLACVYCRRSHMTCDEGI